VTVYPPEIIGPIWGASEICLTLTKRSGAGATSRDRHSLVAIWLVTVAGIALGILAAFNLPSFGIPRPELSIVLGIFAFVTGLALRWYSVIHLGRFFTVDVAIAEDHQLVDSGPYRFIRHPSYAGILLACLGFALSFTNWASLFAIFIPCLAVILWRVHIEEEALIAALGDEYRNYMRRTKRLIPMVY